MLWNATLSVAALIARLGLLGLRVSETRRADVGDLGEEHGHRVLLVHGKGGNESLVPLPPAVAGIGRPHQSPDQAKRCPRRGSNPHWVDFQSVSLDVCRYLLTAFVSCGNN
jgi:hypothetical protein